MAHCDLLSLVHTAVQLMRLRISVAAEAELERELLQQPVSCRLQVSAAQFVEDVDRDPIIILDGLTKRPGCSLPILTVWQL